MVKRTKPRPTENPAYTQLLVKIMNKADSQGVARTSELIERPTLKNRYELDRALHAEKSRINRQILNLGNLLERPIKDGSQACVRISWRGWSLYFLEKYSLTENIDVLEALDLYFESYLTRIASMKNGFMCEKITVDGIMHFALSYLSHLQRGQVDIIQGLEERHRLALLRLRSECFMYFLRRDLNYSMFRVWDTPEKIFHDKILKSVRKRLRKERGEPKNSIR